MTRSAATTAVVREDPDLHQRVIDEGNRVKPVDNPAPRPTQAKAKIDQLVAAKVGDGMGYSKAFAQVLRENEALRQQWVDEENAARRAG